MQAKDHVERAPLPSEASGLELIDIHKSFDNTPALRGVSFSVPQGKIVAVLGPSGCGKSTLLSIVAGLLKPDHGDLIWGGRTLEGIHPHRRGFGLMFQDLTLFPHRNVYDNIAFGLQMTHQPKEQIRTRVAEVLELVGLPGYEERDVNTLSGGEGQRVALARALAPRPRLLMLDEPLGSLDRNLRERLVGDLRRILLHSSGQGGHKSPDHRPQTALYVTHDQEEAFVIADQVVIMNRGQVEQSGAPEEIYRQPGCEFVARFLGLNNLLPGEIEITPSGAQVRTPVGDFPISKIPARGAASGPCLALIRPDTVNLVGESAAQNTQPAPENIHQMSGTVIETTFRGKKRQITIEINDYRLSFDFNASAPLTHPGETVSLCFNPAETVQIINDGKEHH